MVIATTRLMLGDKVKISHATTHQLAKLGGPNVTAMVLKVEPIRVQVVSYATNKKVWIGDEDADIHLIRNVT
jgi:hypothetical protein